MTQRPRSWTSVIVDLVFAILFAVGISYLQYYLRLLWIHRGPLVPLGAVEKSALFLLTICVARGAVLMRRRRLAGKPNWPLEWRIVLWVLIVWALCALTAPRYVG